MTPGINPPSITPVKILIVDDERSIRELLEIFLKKEGFQVIAASSGKEALALATASEFDLIISDLRMPRLGGREFYEELARRRPAMAARLVFSTGDTVRGDTLAFLESLARPYLHKPFSLSELRRLLGEIGRDSGAHALRRDSGSWSVELLPES